MGVFAGIEPTWAAQTDVGRTHIATKGIVQSGLVLNLDAGVSSSYSGSGTTWTDLSGLGNTGTLTNGPTYSSSNGGSLVFDGTNDYVSCGSVSSNLSSGVSFQLIFKSSDLTSRQQGLLTYQSGTIGNPYINLWCPGDGRVRWETYTSTSPNVGTSIFSANLSNNVWYHIIGTYSSNGTNATVRIYVNGVENTSSTISAPNFSNSYNYTLEIGRYQNFGVLLGNIATAQIYNRALAAAEIQQNFQALRGRFGI
jgi:hypothetical protein